MLKLFSTPRNKASVMSVYAEANSHSADWLMSVFVNEIAPSCVRSQQGQIVYQCSSLMIWTLSDFFFAYDPPNFDFDMFEVRGMG